MRSGGALGFRTKDIAYKQSLNILVFPYGNALPGGGGMTTGRVSDTNKKWKKIEPAECAFPPSTADCSALCAVLADCC